MEQVMTRCKVTRFVWRNEIENPQPTPLIILGGAVHRLNGGW